MILSGKQGVNNVDNRKKDIHFILNFIKTYFYVFFDTYVDYFYSYSHSFVEKVDNLCIKLWIKKILDYRRSFLYNIAVCSE